MTRLHSDCATAVACSVRSHVGHVRVRNEDAWVTSFLSGRSKAPDIPSNITSIDGASIAGTGWAIIADGMGGHAAGDAASRAVVGYVGARASELKDADDIRECLEIADHLLIASAQRDHALEGMGSTIAGFIKDDRRALLFNLGDSRIYRLSADTLTKLSVDHVNDDGFLTRFLGGGRTILSPQRLVPDVVEVRLNSGDQILLCSDGLTDALADEDIAKLLQKPNSADALMGAALEADGSDNITLMLLVISDLPLSQPFASLGGA